MSFDEGVLEVVERERIIKITEKPTYEIMSKSKAHRIVESQKSRQVAKFLHAVSREKLLSYVTT